jgi:hypothetical protein
MTVDPEPTESRTLDELDPPAWGAASYDSYLVRRCHELRRTPLRDFEVEDYRIMIGQQIALPILVPRAINILQANPLAEGDFYPGDLLKAVLGIEKPYWHAHVEQWQDVHEIADGLTRAVDELRDPISAFKTTTFSA